MRQLRSLLIGLGLAWWLGLTSPAGARDFRLSYQAPGDCPDATEFQRQVDARARSVTFNATSQEELVVRIRRTADGFKGQASLLGTRRSLDDQSCSDLTNALAFIVVVTLEAEARPQESEQPSPGSAQLDIPSTQSVFLGAQAAVATNPARDPMLALGAFAKVADVGPLPWLRLGVLFGQSEAELLGEPRFTWLSSQLELCVWEVSALSICGAADVGLLSAETSLQAGEPPPRLWFAALVGPRLSLAVVGPLQAELGALLSVTINRDRFRVLRGDGSSLIVHEPGVGGLFTVALAYGFAGD